MRCMPRMYATIDDGVGGWDGSDAFVYLFVGLDHHRSSITHPPSCLPANLPANLITCQEQGLVGGVEGIEGHCAGGVQGSGARGVFLGLWWCRVRAVGCGREGS